MFNNNEWREKLIKKAKANISKIATFDITDQEIESHLIEINKIIKINELCLSNEDFNKCGADGYHFKLVKDENGIIRLENFLCEKLRNNPDFSIQNNFLYISSDIKNHKQRLKPDEIYTTSDKYKYRTNLINKLLDIKREKVIEYGLYVYGELGCGKSYVIMAFCNEMAIKNKTIVYLTMNNFSLNLVKSIRDNTDFKTNIIDELMQADIVIFDELGNETYKEYIHNQLLYPIINSRLNNNKLTIFSSKYDLIGLKKVYKLGSKDHNIDQFIDRIKRICNQNFYNLTPFKN